MKYTLLIKSHTDYPDWEDTCEADSKEDAAFEFAKKLNSSSEDFWNPMDLMPFIAEEPEPINITIGRLRARVRASGDTRALDLLEQISEKVTDLGVKYPHDVI